MKQQCDDDICKCILHDVTEISNRGGCPNNLISSLTRSNLNALTQKSFRPTRHEVAIATGDILSDGLARGKVYYTLKSLKNATNVDEKILFTKVLNNDIMCDLDSVNGIVTTNEDPSSHAVIAANAMGIPVLNCGSKLTLQEGQLISLDAYEGHVFTGKVYIQSSHMDTEAVRQLLVWIRERAVLRVNANADSASEVQRGKFWGAMGYEPRSEHMILNEASIQVFRKYVLCENANKKNVYLARLFELQKQSAYHMFIAANGGNLIIRLFDPPIHEFLPKSNANISDISNSLNLSVDELHKKMESIYEDNPMMGHRGVRLLLSDVPLLEMQVIAIIEASIDATNSERHVIIPHITIPMVVHEAEVLEVKSIINKIVTGLEQKYSQAIPYRVGIMVETPRAVLGIDDLAKHVDYICFGTNDLTAQIFAFSRGDIYEKFLNSYLKNKILNSDPFLVLDSVVKQFIFNCVQSVRKHYPQIKIGLCGEQASDEDTIKFCHDAGIDSISVSPNKILVSQLYAAQLAINVKPVG